MNTEECLICGAPLEYLTQDETMECAVCHKQEASKTRCVNGHYVCSDCHTQGMDRIFGLCLSETSDDPVAILRRMMDLPFCHMHGPEHHVMVGAALLTAYKNAGGVLDLEQALREMYSRGKAVPGGACGFWGACGAGISAGQFLAIATESTPLAREPWGLSNQMTARALDSIGKRCPFSPMNHQNPKVAFLCVHNSCRSQIAEALGRKLAGDVFDSFSAGTEPGSRINPDAVRLMKQVYCRLPSWETL